MMHLVLLSSYRFQKAIPTSSDSGGNKNIQHTVFGSLWRLASAVCLRSSLAVPLSGFVLGGVDLQSFFVLLWRQAPSCKDEQVRHVRCHSLLGSRFHLDRADHLHVPKRTRGGASSAPAASGQVSHLAGSTSNQPHDWPRVRRVNSHAGTHPPGERRNNNVSSRGALRFASARCQGGAGWNYEGRHRGLQEDPAATYTGDYPRRAREWGNRSYVQLRLIDFVGVFFFSISCACRPRNHVRGTPGHFRVPAPGFGVFKYGGNFFLFLMHSLFFYSRKQEKMLKIKQALLS